MEVLLSQFIAPSCFPAEEICLPYPMVFLLGNLINRKDMIQNKYSEKGYSDVVLNINGTAAANVACSTSNLVIPCQRLSNRPFAGSGHMVRNKLNWDANDAVGLPKQRNSYQSSPTFLCFGSPTASFASQCNLFRTM